VVVTAIILARRKIWYDSALLAVVEKRPRARAFHAHQPGCADEPGDGADAGGGAWASLPDAPWCCAGSSGIHLPPRALALGAVLLLLNALLPVLYPPPW